MTDQVQHTPEPWNVDHETLIYLTPDEAGEQEVFIINDGVDRGIGFVPSDRLEDRANARRIVKCVNWCAGFTDEELDELESLQYQDERLMLAFAHLTDLVNLFSAGHVPDATRTFDKAYARAYDFLKDQGVVE